MRVGRGGDEMDAALLLAPEDKIGAKRLPDSNSSATLIKTAVKLLLGSHLQLQFSLHQYNMSSIRHKTVLSAIVPAALLFVLTHLIPSGESVHCWVCSSDVDPRCGDPFNMTHFAITDCNRDRMASSYLGSVGTCKKLKQIVGNEVTVIRSCHWDTSDRSPSDSCQTTSYAKVEHCSTCSTDTCNAAVKGSISAAAALFGCIALASTNFF